MGSVSLCEHITAFFSRAEKPSEDINISLFLMKRKGLEPFLQFEKEATVIVKNLKGKQLGTRLVVGSALQRIFNLCIPKNDLAKPHS
jgi:hypothetical protein